MPGDHPFSALAGTWRGTGEGRYPTIEDFSYTEDLLVAPVLERPLAHWRSTTRDSATGEPRHAESGFIRAVERGVELVVAHSFGLVEEAAGSFDGRVLALRSRAVVGTATAKRVDVVERRYDLDAEVLQYAIAMAAVGRPLTPHLRAELRRT